MTSIVNFMVSVSLFLWRQLRKVITTIKLYLIPTSLNESPIQSFTEQKLSDEKVVGKSSKAPYQKKHIRSQTSKKSTKKKCEYNGKLVRSEQDAKQRAKQLRSKSINGHLHAYHCQFGPHWHLTHQKRNVFY